MSELKHPIWQAQAYKNGKSSKEQIEALSIGFVHIAIYDESHDYLDKVAQISKEIGVTEAQYIAMSASEYELHGRKRIDNDTVIEKHIGWMAWFVSEPEADMWIEQKRTGG